jgi:hypothetical protein
LQAAEPWLERQVLKRIVTLSKLWPGITPLNVYDLEHGVWCALALSCDAEVAAAEKQNQENSNRASARR